MDTVQANAAAAASSGGMNHSVSHASLHSVGGNGGSNYASGYSNVNNNGSGANAGLSYHHLNQGSPSTNIHNSLYTPTPNTSLTVATSFLALPDIAETSRGSGLITAFNQESGILTVGGNSPTIRLWDLSREQCVRIFNTGLDTCTSAIAVKPLSSHFFTSPEFKLNPSRNQQLHGKSISLQSASSSHFFSTIFPFLYLFLLNN